VALAIAFIKTEDEKVPVGRRVPHAQFDANSVLCVMHACVETDTIRFLKIRIYNRPFTPKSAMVNQRWLVHNPLPKIFVIIFALV
jgi:hypothetical protein